MDIRETLLSLQDDSYKSFHQRLIPTVDPDTVIGVRVPQLRVLAKELKNDPQTARFLSDCPHHCYEENMLHALLINMIREPRDCFEAVNRFLPFVDNWAVCDGLRPKAITRNKEALLTAIDGWMHAEHPYTVRFGMEMLMIHFLGNDFSPAHLKAVAAVKSDHYYVNMMVAWYFATALAKQWDSTLVYIQDRLLPSWVHKKTIQKACESRCLSPEQKAILRVI